MQAADAFHNWRWWRRSSGASVAPRPFGGRRRCLLLLMVLWLVELLSRRRRFSQIGQPRVFQTLFSRQPLPGVFHQQFSDKVHRFRRHVFEELVGEIDVGVGYVAERLLVSVTAKRTEPRQQGVRGHA